MKLFSSHIVRLREKTQKRLDEYIHPSVGFFLLTALSAGIATIGLVLNNVGIVIGAMLVAPLITPLFGFALGLIVFRVHRMFLSLVSLLSGTVLVIVVSVGVMWIASIIDPTSVMLTSEILARAEPNLLFFVVALLSGMAGAYVYTKLLLVLGFCCKIGIWHNRVDCSMY